MKFLIFLILPLLSVTATAQAQPSCAWATSSNWACSPKAGSGDGVNVLFSPDWKTASVTLGSVSGTFNFVSSDGTTETYKDGKNVVLTTPTGACLNSGGFDLTLAGQAYSCF